MKIRTIASLFFQITAYLLHIISSYVTLYLILHVYDFYPRQFDSQRLKLELKSWIRAEMKLR